MGEQLTGTHWRWRWRSTHGRTHRRWRRRRGQRRGRPISVSVASSHVGSVQVVVKKLCSVRSGTARRRIGGCLKLSAAEPCCSLVPCHTLSAMSGEVIAPISRPLSAESDFGGPVVAFGSFAVRGRARLGCAATGYFTTAWTSSPTWAPRLSPAPRCASARRSGSTCGDLIRRASGERQPYFGFRHYVVTGGRGHASSPC